MIITNGYILFRKSEAKGLDSDGYPTSATEEWGEPVECQCLPNTTLRDKSRNEAYTAHSYTLLVERMDIPGEVVKLFNERGEVGQFSILSYEHLDAVQQTRIII
ncbi:MAG: hypothetical protein J6V00_07645 [Bacteroidaceae bacterium]|jgi:hypothetical protein|nr:hypothetical protein [Bacteroidaceae bacterium]